MPRKKVTDPVTPLIQETEIAPVAETTVTETKSRRGRARTPETVPTESPTPAQRTRRTAKAEAPTTEPTVEPTPEPVVKKRRGLAAKIAEAIEKPTRGRRKKAEPEQVTLALDEPAAQAEPTAPEKTQRGRRGRGRSTPVAATPYKKPEPDKPLTPEEIYAAVEEDLPVPTWRTRQVPEVKLVEVESVSETEKAADEKSGKRPRRRRRRGKGEADTEVETKTIDMDVSEEEDITFAFRPAAKPEPPKAPVRPTVEIPVDAPQVVMRDGIPTLVRDKTVYPPLFFFGSATDEKRVRTVLDEVKLAADSGVHLFSFMIDFEVSESSVADHTAMAAYLLAQTLEIDPKAQVVFRVVFQAPQGWDRTYKKARWKTEVGNSPEPSLCDDEFWGDAKNSLQSFVKSMRLLPQNGAILGIHLERGEWFLTSEIGYDRSEAAEEKFRDWARHRYQNDVVTLRASWFDGNVTFDSLTIPAYQPEGSEGDRFVRSSRKQRRYVDYHLFLSDATVQRIGELAYAVKEASEGYFLVGASYGYTFEWSHPSSGHLSLGKLLRTPEIDFIAGPPSYKNREPGGTSAFPCPIDSFAINGKLYISEEDFKTSISERPEPDDFNPVIRTPQALDSVHWRGAGAAIAHGSGVCWMDLWGNGWLRTASIWQRAAAISENLVQRMGSPLSEPDVAVFIDERSLAYLVDQNAFNLLVQNVRESVLRSGMSAGFYLLSDLAHREKFPESRVYLFLNAWDLRPEYRAAIKSRLQKDGKVLFWLYSAGLFDSGRDSLERAREATGIALKPQPFYSKSGTTILNRRHPLCDAFPDRIIESISQLEPSYFGIPEEAVVLGEYSQTGLPSFLARTFTGESDWTSVFLGEPVVTPALIRALGQMAGAHVWNFHEDVVHVCAPYVTVHCTGNGPRTLALPDRSCVYDLLKKEWVATESTSLRFHANDGSTHVFLIGVKAEIETLLAQDPTALLHMEELPEKHADTAGLSDLSFDVPLMKLGEWMEGGSDEDQTEELFLRPRFLEIEEAPAESSEFSGRRRGGRRRGRRGGADRGGTEETASPRREAADLELTEDDVELSVMFRKRDS